MPSELRASPPPAATTHRSPAPHGTDVRALCANCGAPLAGRYCSECGEKQPDAHDYSLAGLLHEALHTFSHVDGTLLRTLRALFARPGLLTVEYFAGRKSRYMRPLPLFVVLNVLFFVVQPHTGLLRYRLDEYTDFDRLGPGAASAAVPATLPYAKTRAVQRHLAATGETLDEYRPHFEAVLQANKKSMLIFSIPLFALCLQLLVRRRAPHFAQQLVFSVHAYAFFLAFLIVGVTGGFALLYAVLRTLGPPGVAVMRVLETQGALIVVVVGAIGTYLYLAVRRVYGLGRWNAAFVALALAFVQQFVVLAYREALFWMTLWQT